MKKVTALLLAAVLLFSLVACGNNGTEEPSGTEPTSATTVPVDDGIEHFDLNEIDLDGIGEQLAQRDENTLSRIRLDGLCTPVELELRGTDLVSISAYGITVFVDPDAADYASIYGNLWPVIYDHNGLVFLNIWHDEIGYSCVMFPDNSYIENYPGEEFSVMIYVTEEGRMVQYQFTRRFQGIEQWDTGPIDMAISRDDVYYMIDDAHWSQDEYHVIAAETYTISDCFDLDEIFEAAKANGLYPEFETLEALFAYNEQRFQEDTGSSDGPDSVLEEVRYFDELRAAYEYDSNGNLLTEAFYTHQYDSIYFTKAHTYDEQNREIAGTWIFDEEEAYRYSNTYDSKGRLTETVWYQNDEEVERFTYTYDKTGGYTETFSQAGEKKYTYTFNKSGELTAHTVYHGGKAVKTKDISGLVKTQLLTDIWFPFIDNDTVHSQYRYNGTVPTQAPVNARKTTAADGSYLLILEGVDEEDGSLYRHEYGYDANDRLMQKTHIWDGVEHLRDEYQYDQKGRCILQVTYFGGEKDMTTERQYNSAGQLIKLERTHVTPETYYTYDEDGDKEVTYTVRTETYRYNDEGLLAETVVYEDGKETDRTAYDYDSNGYVLPRLDSYQYVYDAEGILEQVWLIYEDYSAGAALLRSRTVYVTPENANQIQEILRTELSWF